MSSIIQGYEYDIFISYRQNDNRSGWVTEFVNALQDELAATLKDPVSIYFDSNPHDGLHETHDVDGSLKEKVKCLIFIPIVSQTYCDPKSFAWEKEFLAFLNFAKQDEFGLDIKLLGGNVSKRVLPIRIHNLDKGDLQLFEKEIGGVMRSVDFVYKEAGVNRPLSEDDSEEKNLNQTRYKNQVNKVANAIKEIVLSTVSPNTSETLKIQDSTVRPGNSKRILRTIISILVLGFALLTYFFYPKTVVVASDEIEKSVAILPLVDLSEQKDQGWFADGLTEEILNSLAHINGLSVSSRTSSFAFKDKNLPVQVIADSLGVSYIVEGSVRKYDNGLRITAQLIRASDGFHIWSNTYDSEAKEIFKVQKEIAMKVTESLDILLDSRNAEQMHWAGTDSPEAALEFFKAQKLDNEAHMADRFIDLVRLKQANLLYEQSSLLDPDFANPYLYHADFYLHYILKHDPLYRDTLTDQQAYHAFMNDLNNAILKSKGLSQADYYRIPKVMYSNDWTDFRNVIEKSLYSKDAPVLFRYSNFNFTSMIIILGYGNRITEISEAIRGQDPYDLSGFGNIILSLIYEGKYDEALTRISKVNIEFSRVIKYYQYYAMIQLGKIDEAFDLISKDANNESRYYYDLMALILAKQNNIEKAKEILSIQHRNSPFYLLAVNAVYGRSEANRKAALMDKNILLDFPLFESISLSPFDLPYDLSETPNFARKLKQAGVILNQGNKYPHSP